MRYSFNKFVQLLEITPGLVMLYGISHQISLLPFVTSRIRRASCVLAYVIVKVAYVKILQMQKFNGVSHVHI